MFKIIAASVLALSFSTPAIANECKNLASLIPAIQAEDNNPQLQDRVHITLQKLMVAKLNKGDNFMAKLIIEDKYSTIRNNRDKMVNNVILLSDIVQHCNNP